MDMNIEKSKTDSIIQFDEITGKILARAYPGICTSINSNDDMFNYLANHLGRSTEQTWTEYFNLGQTTLALLTQILKSTGKQWGDVEYFLDFAAGYGRCTRFMSEVLEPKSIWVSDILPSAVEFHREHFKVQGFVSDVDPDSVSMPQKFDYISVISLFTHLPDPTFHAWLRKLSDTLAPGGILVFTTQGLDLCGQVSAGGSSESSIFENHSESDILDKDSYGSMYCSPDYIEQAVNEIPGASLLAQFPKGLNNHQDVNVLGKDVSGDAKNVFTLSPDLQLFLDHVVFDSKSKLKLNGWAMDDQLKPVERVELLIDGEFVGHAQLLEDRPDVAEHFNEAKYLKSGWVFETVLEKPPTLIAVVAHCANGARRIVAHNHIST